MSANFLRKHLYAATLLALSGAIAFSPSLQQYAMAQTNISGDISGVITDPSGAAIPGATVTVTSKTTGSSKTATTGARGEYRVPLLQPGDYSVTIAANGFEGQHTTITVQAGQVASGDSKLTVGKATQTVDVSASEALLHTEDAQISTSFSMEQVQSLPNPGNDLTFVAQTSPGAVMNTQGGYGNFSVFGLPATSNTFTVNGGYQNDPFLNLNNSGATNLLLGNNDVADVTVTSNAYDAAFGGLGGAQINEISRSGGNGYHGNATYWWNGRTLNANDWFKKENGEPRSFDNVNQWAAAIGGPIKKDKAFWFANYEGLRVVLPNTSPVYAPSPQTIADITSGTPITPNNELPEGNLAYQGNQAEIANYATLFQQWTNAPGYNPTAFVSNPGPSFFGTNFLPTEFVTYQATAGNFTHEYLITARTDFNLGQNDKAFIHFKLDKGLQATFTSLLNPIFNADSPQPEYNGEFQETHTFSPNLTNQFLLAAEYYRAIFTNTNLAAANVITPFSFAAVLDSPLDQDGLGGLPGGEDFVWPQGRNVTNYQVADDVSWTKGNHTIKVGYSIRRDDVSDFDPSVLSVAAEAVTSFETFAAGNIDEWVQAFPQKSSQPLALYNEGFYVQDQWKALSNLTVTYGLRMEHNSNPICITNCFGYSNGDFFGLPTSTTTPLNQLIKSGQHAAFPNLQKLGYEPRIGFAWLPAGPGTHTTVRGGFGMFTDVFPATVADSLLNNPLTSVVVPVVGPLFTGACDPTVSGCGAGTGAFPSTGANSATASASGVAVGIQQGFNSGAPSSVVGAPSLTTAAQKINYPTYEEYSLALEQQVNRTTALSVSYVGNHGYHEPVVNGSANGYSSNGLLPGAPTAPANSNFQTVTIDYAGATSNYNGLIASVVNHQRYLTLQFNYAYSHALDEISNGGFLPFGGNAVAPINPANLSQQYGNADYDTRHYISGSYVFTIPHWGGPRVLVDNWELAGTVFHNNGYPFSVTDGSASTNFGLVNYSSPLAQQTGVGFNTHCGGNGHANPPSASGNLGTACGFANNFTAATAFGEQNRNQIYGSSYTDTDLDVTKGFKLPHWESSNLKLGAQFFNLFNHPNFGQPYHDITNPQIGVIPGLQGTPTSILGAFLGGDSAPRLIQLKASFVF